MKKSEKKLNVEEFAEILSEKQKDLWVEMKTHGLEMGCFMLLSQY